jgi:uncharacterized protein (DUF433 family)
LTRPSQESAISEEDQWDENYDAGYLCTTSPAGPSTLTADHYVVIRLESAIRDMRSCIDIDPMRAGGKPVLKGTRFTVAQVISQIAEGDTVDDLTENFRLDGGIIRCFLRALSVAFDRTYYR